MVVVLGGCGKRGTEPVPPPSATVTQPELSWQTGGQRSEGLPISLTASDGSGLELISIEARAVIEDPLAFTELRLRFRNPEARRREGRFQISLPPTAAVSRFAMRIGGTFQEGELVERRRAQQVYEDYLHRKQDPALLEKAAGNEFGARVFPIEPDSVQELIVSYSEELERRDTPYRLLVQGLPRLQELSVLVQVGELHLALREHDYVPSSDLQVRLPWQKPLALRNGELVVARVAPVLTVPAASVPGLTVLFDSSASRALGFGAQIERLAALLAELEKRTGQAPQLRVIAFDQGSEELYRGPASGFDLRAQSKLLARDALGASDLGQALAFVAENPDGNARLLVIGDGVITAGIEDTTSLREAVARLGAHGVRRVDVLAEGGIQDRDALAALTRAGLAETGVVMDASAPLAQLADRMLKGTRERVEVHIAGAQWIYPSVLEGLQPGDERLVFAELPAQVPVQIELLGASAEAHETREVPRPLLERAWARAKIESMTLERRALGAEDSRAGRLERDIVELSLSRRVVSDYTAWLVLEGPAEYARFGLEQRALTDILRVGQQGLELWDRQGPSIVQIAAADPEPVAREAQGALGNAPGGCASETPGVVTERRKVEPASPPAPSPVAAPKFEEQWDDKAPEPEPPTARDEGFAQPVEEKAKGDSLRRQRVANDPPAKEAPTPPAIAAERSAAAP
ncbi:MAG TPA: VIT domain-containing protein, partial [Polyangiales bacterium]|nr:VIT domain-containing protein [Polyangiales bacterium]